MRFRHELARTAVEEAILAPRAMQLHARLLAALLARATGPADLAQLAHHAERAGDVDAVLRWAAQAAREAGLRGARREAVAQARAALGHAHRLDAAAHAALLDDYATHCFDLNDMAAAIPAREQAIDLFARAGMAGRQSEALASLAFALVRALRNVDADRASRQAIALAEALPPGPTLARAHATESYLRMLNRDYEDAVAWGERAIALAERFDDRVTLAGVYNSVGAALMFVDYERGCAHVLKSPTPTSPPTRRRPSASTTARRPNRSAPSPSATSCPSTGSPRSRCSTRTSIEARSQGADCAARATRAPSGCGATAARPAWRRRGRAGRA